MREDGAASILLRHTATLGDAAARVGAAYCPLLVLVDEQERVVGVVREEQVRIGLTGAGRVHHALADLAAPASDVEEITIDADGRLASYRPPDAPRLDTALVMAGGQGTRLSPLTDDCPKPLLPVQGQPLLHRVLGQLRAAGISRAFVSVRYLAERVRESLGDGTGFDLTIEFLEEDEPLGTAGALASLPELDQPLLVMNGDILSDINLVALAAWHERHANQATVATHLFEVEVPFGLAHFTEQRLDRLEEKPTLRLPVNAGIYVFAPELIGSLTAGPLDMVTWLNELAQAGVVGQFPIVEPWHDIGSIEAYRRLS